MTESRSWGIRFTAAEATLPSGGLDKARPLQRRNNLQRLFSAFPGGYPGAGLLLLRTAVGAMAVIQGGSYLADPGNLTLRTSVAGVLGISSGTSLILGFLTPVAGSVVGLDAIGAVLSWFPPPALNPFDATLPTMLAAVVATAVVFLGPGALSVDARLFGRREIIIPECSRSAKS